MDKILTSDISTTDDVASKPDTASRAIVAVTAAGPAVTSRRPSHRPAVFLAHLIATKDRHPQTRKRRRAEPAEALSAYRRALAATAANQ